MRAARASASPRQPRSTMGSNKSRMDFSDVFKDDEQIW
jgi:hypothetical protein